MTADDDLELADADPVPGIDGALYQRGYITSAYAGHIVVVYDRGLDAMVAFGAGTPVPTQHGSHAAAASLSEQYGPVLTLVRCGQRHDNHHELLRPGLPLGPDGPLGLDPRM